MAGPGEFLVTMMTALILPAVVILIVAFFTGGIEAEEDAKYMAIVGEPDGWDVSTEDADEDAPAQRRWSS